jgi:hypothetical protein
MVSIEITPEALCLLLMGYSVSTELDDGETLELYVPEKPDLKSDFGRAILIALPFLGENQ